MLPGTATPQPETEGAAHAGQFLSPPVLRLMNEEDVAFATQTIRAQHAFESGPITDHHKLWKALALEGIFTALPPNPELMVGLAGYIKNGTESVSSKEGHAPLMLREAALAAMAVTLVGMCLWREFQAQQNQSAVSEPVPVSPPIPAPSNPPTAAVPRITI